MTTRIEFSLEDPDRIGSGTWDLVSFGGGATAVGSLSEPTLVLDVVDVSVPTQRRVDYVPDNPSVAGLRLTARTTQYPPGEREQGSRPVNPRHAFRIGIGPAQAVWLSCTDTERDQLPDGHVFLDAPLASLPNVTLTPGLTTGEATLSGGVYGFLDDKRELRDWLAGKFSNGLELFGATVQQYDLDEDDDLNDATTLARCLRYTWQVRDQLVMDDALVKIKCSDIQRELDADIISAEPFRLYHTIGASLSTVIPITLPVDGMAARDFGFEHGPDYIVTPGETMMIFKIGSGEDLEYIGCRGFRSDEFATNGNPVVTLLQPLRGMFGTEPREHEVGEDTPLESRPEMLPVAYAEEDPVSLAHAIMTGEFLDGRTWPWGRGVAARWVNTASFASATSGRRRTLLRTEKVNAKRFIEEQILSFLPGFMYPDPTGALTLKQIAYFRKPSARAVLDESTCYGGDLSALTRDASDTGYPIVMTWDKSPLTDEYRQETHWLDEAAADALADEDGTRHLEPIEYESELLTSSRQTESELRAASAIFSARHARPVERLSAKPSRELWHLMPGDAVTVRHYPEHIANGSGIAKPIDTPAVIASVVDRQSEQGVDWRLIAHSAPPPSLLDGGEPLPAQAYTEGGIALPGISGSVASGSPNLRLGQKYYHLGDLTLSAGWAPVWQGEGDLILWVRGVLLWAADVDLTGLGLSTPNSQGYHEAPPAGGSWLTNVTRFTNSSGAPQGITRVRVRSHPPPRVASVNVGAFAEGVTVERGRVVGIPTMLAGRSGGPGSQCKWGGLDDQGKALASGSIDSRGYGVGGGGAQILSYPGSAFVGDGRLTLDGADSASPDFASDARGYAAMAAPGARGHATFITDGQGTPWPIDGTRLVARDGRTRPQGKRAESATWEQRNSISSYRSYYDSTVGSANQWADSHTIVVLPPSQTPSDRNYQSSFDEFFADQPDGLSIVRVQLNKPGDGNRGDLWVQPQYLLSTSQTPPIEVFVQGVGYQPVDWTTTRFGTVYRSMLAIARRGGNTLHYGPERPAEGEYTDGDEWINSNTGLGYILYSGREDVLNRAGDYQLGANKWPKLAKYLAGEQVIFVHDDLDTLPQFPDPGADSGFDGVNGGDAYPALNSLRTEAGTSQVEIYIGLPSDDDGITGYVIRRDGQVIATVTGGYYLDTGLTPSTQYRYEVYATGPDGDGRSLTSSATTDAGTTTGGGGSGGGGATTATLTAPTNFTVDIYSRTSAQLNWTAVPAASRGAATEYVIQQDGSEIQRYSDLNRNSKFMDSGLAEGQTYTWRIRTEGGGEISAWVDVTGTMNSS